MALILIIGGTFIGTIAALVQCLVMDATIARGVVTYFTFGLGLPITVGLAKWIEIKLRGMFQSLPILRVQQADS